MYTSRICKMSQLKLKTVLHNNEFINMKRKYSFPVNFNFISCFEVENEENSFMHISDISQ